MIVSNVTRATEANPIRKVAEVLLADVRPIELLCFNSATEPALLRLTKTEVYPVMDRRVSSLVAFPLRVLLANATLVPRLKHPCIRLCLAAVICAFRRSKGAHVHFGEVFSPAGEAANLGSEYP